MGSGSPNKDSLHDSQRVVINGQTSQLNQSQQVTMTNKSIGRDSTNSGGARTNIRSIRSLQNQIGNGVASATSKKDKTASDLIAIANSSI
jgi:uncharacterized sporulation protein YeaH/YhbH (DUF444 family)